MQIRAAIVKIHIFFHIFATTHANVTQMVSKCMFTWSNSTLDALKIIIYVDNEKINYFNFKKIKFLFFLNNSMIILQCSQECVIITSVFANVNKYVLNTNHTLYYNRIIYMSPLLSRLHIHNYDVTLLAMLK